VLPLLTQALLGALRHRGTYRTDRGCCSSITLSSRPTGASPPSGPPQRCRSSITVAIGPLGLHPRGSRPGPVALPCQAASAGRLSCAPWAGWRLGWERAGLVRLPLLVVVNNREVGPIVVLAPTSAQANKRAEPV